MFSTPILPDDAKRTFRVHLVFTAIDAVAAGILGNVPMIAVSHFHAKDKALTIPLGMSCIGMFASLYASIEMSYRGKMGFVKIPGIGFALAVALMALVRAPLPFLMLAGVGAILEMVTRPAITAIIRQNYPASLRGAAMGSLRGWASLIFLIANMGSAALLDHWRRSATMVPAQLVIASVLLMAAYICFGRIIVNEPPVLLMPELASRIRATVEPLLILKRDARFRKYMIGAGIFGISGLFYVSILPAFLAKDLRLNYTRAALALHVVPALCAAIATSALGRRSDRSNPMETWAGVRLGWGLDPLILALSVALPSALAFPVALIGRASRGTVQGASYVLWWQTGVHHFAPPGIQTTRYMSVLIFINGFIRIFAAVLTSLFLFRFSRISVLVVGGIGVLASALHAHLHARHERGNADYRTIDAFEKSHSNQV